MQGPPVVLLDLDGTARGDVGPMARLARPLMPRFLDKALRREPVNARKLLRFVWNLGRLWVLRVIHRSHRRRYKTIFSELHHLAAALLEGEEVEAIRLRYREATRAMPRLWHDGAVELLRRMDPGVAAVLVTGSEQVQTEACVELLAARGVGVERIHVRGSRYAADEQSGRFTGAVESLNVTIDGKRDVVREFQTESWGPIRAAFGNSRPDRALFEAVDRDGLRVLVCPSSVVRARSSSTFVIRKLERSGFAVHFDADAYLAALRELRADTETLPVLACAADLEEVIGAGGVARHYPELFI